MAFILFDDWLYMEHQGQVGNYGRDELKRHGLAKIKKVDIAFIDCQTKIIQGQYDVAQKNALINAHFSQDEVVQEEKIDSNTCQLIAVRKDIIEDINAYFKNQAEVQTLVPYPMAIRALLKEKLGASFNSLIIMVDDLKTQAIVTLFDQMHFSSPRRISMRDLDYMSSEIRRSLIGFGGTHKELMIASNNKQWLEGFIKSGFFTKEQVVHLDYAYPALEGLKKARFGLRFVLPEELARVKKNEILRKRLRESAGVVVLGVGSVCIYAIAQFLFHDAALKKEFLESKYLAQSNELAILSKDKLRSVFAEYKYPSLVRVYFDLQSSLLAGHSIERFNVKIGAENKWEVLAVIFPFKSSYVNQALEGQGYWKNAQVNMAFNKGILGKEFKIQLDLQRGHS